MGCWLGRQEVIAWGSSLYLGDPQWPERISMQFWWGSRKQGAEEGWWRDRMDDQQVGVVIEAKGMTDVGIKSFLRDS